MSGPNCLSRGAAKASPITAITANAWSTNKTNFSFSPNAVIPTAPAIIANKGRQHGDAKAITRAPTDPMPSSKATVRVRRLMLISAKVSQSQQSRPRSEECQQWPTPTLDNPSDNSSPLFLSAPDQPAASIKAQNSAAIGPRLFRFHPVSTYALEPTPRSTKFCGVQISQSHFTVSEKLRCPCPCGPSKEIFAFQSPDMPILILAR